MGTNLHWELGLLFFFFVVLNQVPQGGASLLILWKLTKWPSCTAWCETGSKRTQWLKTFKTFWIRFPLNFIKIFSFFNFLARSAEEEKINQRGKVLELVGSLKFGNFVATYKETKEIVSTSNVLIHLNCFFLVLNWLQFLFWVSLPEKQLVSYAGRPK